MPQTIPAPVAGVVAPEIFLYRPGGVAEGNVYTDFTLCHAAALLAPGRRKIQIDSSLTSPAVIPAGTYDMTDIALVGCRNSNIPTLGLCSVTFEDGAVLEGLDTLENIHVLGGDAGAPGARAEGLLLWSGNAGDTEIVTIGLRTYTFESVFSDTADKVLIGGTASDSVDNLIAAINGDAGEGSTYGTGTAPHAIVEASRSISHEDITVTAPDDVKTLFDTAGPNFIAVPSTLPIVAGTVTIRWTSGGDEYTQVDDGVGGFTGDGTPVSSSIDYTTGAITLDTASLPPDTGTIIEIEYQPTGDRVYVMARLPGVDGNVTSTTNMVNASWSPALTGGVGVSPILYDSGSFAPIHMVNCRLVNGGGAPIIKVTTAGTFFVVLGDAVVFEKGLSEILTVAEAQGFSWILKNNSEVQANTLHGDENAGIGSIEITSASRFSPEAEQSNWFGSSLVNQTQLSSKAELVELEPAPLINVSTADVQSGIEELDAAVEDLRTNKKIVDYAAVGNIDINAAPIVIDGAGVSGLFKLGLFEQDDKSENGIYYASFVGSGSNGIWVRHPDYDTSEDWDPGDEVYVQNGDVNATTTYKLLTPNPIVLDTTDLEFVQGGAFVRSDATGIEVLASAADNISTSETATTPIDCRDFQNITFWIYVTGHTSSPTSLNVKVAWSEDNALYDPQHTEDVVGGTAPQDTYEATFAIPGAFPGNYVKHLTIPTFGRRYAIAVLTTDTGTLTASVDAQRGA